MPNGKDEKPGSNKWAVMGGIALNVEHTRKYGFEASAAARVTARLVAVPPPTAFQEAVQADVAGRAKLAAASPGQAITPAAEEPGEEEWEDEDSFTVEETLASENTLLFDDELDDDELDDDELDDDELDDDELDEEDLEDIEDRLEIDNEDQA
jgi:hypothetical protein